MAWRLGGIEIAGAPRLHGHSDGDVVLHAVADALLGAAGLGDLGRLFPADPTTPRGIASARAAARASSSASAARAGDRSASTSRSSARGRGLAARLDAMRDAIARAARASTPSAVSVKASTGNLDGRRRRRPRRSPRWPSRRSRRPDEQIRLQDTLGGETRPLEPLEPGHVRIYCCGPTVYGPAHVGNFRTFLFADLLVRYLRWRGLRRDVGHEHHRRRRQDHRRCGGGRRRSAS